MRWRGERGTCISAVLSHRVRVMNNVVYYKGLVPQWPIGIGCVGVDTLGMPNMLPDLRVQRVPVVKLLPSSHEVWRRLKRFVTICTLAPPCWHEKESLLILIWYSRNKLAAGVFGFDF